MIIGYGFYEVQSAGEVCEQAFFKFPMQPLQIGGSCGLLAVNLVSASVGMVVHSTPSSLPVRRSHDLGNGRVCAPARCPTAIPPSPNTSDATTLIVGVTVLGPRFSTAASGTIVPLNRCGFPTISLT